MYANVIIEYGVKSLNKTFSSSFMFFKGYNVYNLSHNAFSGIAIWHE